MLTSKLKYVIYPKMVDHIVKYTVVVIVKTPYLIYTHIFHTGAIARERWC